MKRRKIKLSEMIDPMANLELQAGDDVAKPSSKSFKTWKEYCDYLIKEDAEIPYIILMIYLGGIASQFPQQDGAIDFNKTFGNHPRFNQFQEALKGKISEAFQKMAFYAGGSDGKDGFKLALYTLINDSLYGGNTASYYASIMKNLLKSYFGSQLSPDELVITTVGNAGIGGKEIYGPPISDKGTETVGSKYAIKHPSFDASNKVEFIDPYDFDFFAFVSKLPQRILTHPNIVEADKNESEFSVFYSIDGTGIPGNPDAVLAGSLKRVIESGINLPGFPNSAEEVEQSVAAIKQGVDDETAAPKKESIELTKTQLKKLIMEMLYN